MIKNKMKLFSSKQIALLDAYTIDNEPITSIDLMERASFTIFNELINLYDKTKNFIFFIGPGNNGGDGLTVARIMLFKGYKCEIFILKITDKLSPDATINLKRLKKNKNVCILEIQNKTDFPEFKNDSIIIDALFGSGLSRPLNDLAGDLVKHINKSGCEIISIDIPSGLSGEENTKNNCEYIIKASYTFSFQFPKISFLFAENEQYTGVWKVLPIGLHPDAILNTESNYFYITKEIIAAKIKKRNKFAHKGTYGHALLIAGSTGKMGAAVLSARSCLRSGAGLLTVLSSKENSTILQITVPEAMVDTEECNSSNWDLTPFSAIGVGPGIGKDKKTQFILENILKNTNVPLVLDADAINIISENKKLLKLIPAHSVLTPHPKEFDRLAGKSENGYLRHLKQIEFAKTYNLIIVLKGAHTSIEFPDGNCYFNSTGNPGMATAGSGDVLTGIILSLLAQCYETKDAALIGVYLHGLAGDFAAEERSEESMIASDIIENLGKAFGTLMVNG